VFAFLLTALCEEFKQAFIEAGGDQRTLVNADQVLPVLCKSYSRDPAKYGKYLLWEEYVDLKRDCNELSRKLRKEPEDHGLEVGAAERFWREIS
jgi:hypothetical protein